VPFSVGDACEAVVDGTTVLTGFIEKIDISYSADSHSIMIRGRDKTGDFVDSTIGSITDITGKGSTLKSIIEVIIEHLGSDLEVVELTTTDPFIDGEDILAPEPGENAFSFCEKLARKRQVLLTSNAAGNIVITQAQSTSTNSGLQNLLQNNPNSEDNNILAASASYSSTGVFNKYIVISQQNPVALFGATDTDLANIVFQSGGTDLDGDNGTLSIRTGRQKVLINEKSATADQSKKRAEWQANFDLSRVSVYSATVHDFRDDKGDLWEINRTVSIVDDFVDISTQMLINNIVFSFTVTNGSQSTIGFVQENAYTLEIEEPVSKKRTDKNGDSYIKALIKAALDD
jgi:prophage tail gpP-like protein